MKNNEVSMRAEYTKCKLEEYVSRWEENRDAKVKWKKLDYSSFQIVINSCYTGVFVRLPNAITQKDLEKILDHNVVITNREIFVY